MTLNSVITVILRYITEIGGFENQLYVT